MFQLPSKKVPAPPVSYLLFVTLLHSIVNALKNTPKTANYAYDLGQLKPKKFIFFLSKDVSKH